MLKFAFRYKIKKQISVSGGRREQSRKSSILNKFIFGLLKTFKHTLLRERIQIKGPNEGHRDSELQYDFTNSLWFFDMFLLTGHYTFL